MTGVDEPKKVRKAISFVYKAGNNTRGWRGTVVKRRVYSRDNEAAPLYCIRYEKRNLIKIKSFIFDSEYLKQSQF